MNRREVAALLNYAGALDSRIGRVVADQQRAAHAIGRWTEALTDVPAVAPDGSWDATHVVRRYYEQRGDNSARYYAIDPHHLLAAWARHRATVMDRHTDPTPSADPDNERAWRAELLATRHAVAAGQAAPTTHRQLTSGGPQSTVTARLADVGSPIPARVREQLAAYRPRRAEREVRLTAGRPDPLSVPCGWCGAHVGKPCRSRRVAPNGAATGSAHREPHPSRTEAAQAKRG
ncbi:hypothetical protein [Streptomyces sp. ODS28]|uniref:zinc finger domain-containing protein n=1 Tax=Streptomyces sp. ODS28 TaxID=3136688 RepID=UPI0031E7DCDA